MNPSLSQPRKHQWSEILHFLNSKTRVCVGSVFFFHILTFLGWECTLVSCLFLPASLPVINLMVPLIVDGVLGMEEAEPRISSCLDHRRHLTPFIDFSPHWTNILIKVVWCVAGIYRYLKKKNKPRLLSTSGHTLTLCQTTKSQQVLNIDEGGRMLSSFQTQGSETRRHFGDL